uniref:Uncharacterized protein n=1 Tax=Arundo donax TaxID=35708 RepID=A0A0A9AXU8_ARUDO
MEDNKLFYNLQPLQDHQLQGSILFQETPSPSKTLNLQDINL